jgi:hypothetical protein
MRYTRFIVRRMMNKLSETRYKVRIIDPNGHCIRVFEGEGISETALLRLMNYHDPQHKFGVDFW